MLSQEEKIYVEQACLKLKERGWFPGEKFDLSTITEQEIAGFEQQHQVTLPSLYRTFLTSFALPQKSIHICATIYDMGDFGPLWLRFDCPRTMMDISEQMEILQEIRDFCELPEGCFRNLIPIGDWGAGWGPLCIDLSKPEEMVDGDDEDTWSLVWFDHEDFDWDEQYLGEDGLLHGQAALPSLKVLLDWYFYGELENKYEQEEGVTPTYEWYQDTLKL